MTRRKFLKSLVAVGVVAAAGLPLFEETIPNLKDYPGITYQRDYIKSKSSYLHSFTFIKDKNTQWEIFEYSFEKELHPAVLSDMLSAAKKVGYLHG